MNLGSNAALSMARSSFDILEYQAPRKLKVIRSELALFHVERALRLKKLVLTTLHNDL